MSLDSDSARLIARVASYREEMVAFQVALTAVRALGPSNGGAGEWERAEFLVETAREFGLTDVERVDAEDDRVPSGLRPNAVIRLRGRESRPKIWVMAHMDTVPPGEPTLWDGDPFDARVDAGRIIGRGVEDNQHGLTAALFALRALADEGLAPPADVCLLLVADEETGNAYGVDHVLGARPDLFDGSDLVIVPDSGSKDGSLLEVAEKSSLWVRLAVRGAQVHASLPQKGLNANRVAAHLTIRLDEALHSAFPGQDPLFEPPGSTFEPTKRDANVENVNTVPGDDVSYFDCRVLPEYALDDVQNVIESISLEVQAEFGAQIDVSYPAVNPAAPSTPADADVVRVLADAVHDVRDVETRPVGIGGGTVAASFRRRGIPAVVWATIDETAHSANEYCVIDNLVADAQVFAQVFAHGPSPEET